MEHGGLSRVTEVTQARGGHGQTFRPGSDSVPAPVGSRAADPWGAIVMVPARCLSRPSGTVRAGGETGLEVRFWRLLSPWRRLRGGSQWGSRAA